MQKGQRRIPRFLIACALVAALGLVPEAIPARAGGVVGNGTPGSCTEAALNTALAGGGSVTFSCGPGPHTILTTSQKSINLDTTIDGGGTITLDGQDAHRLFDVGASLTLHNITLTRGRATDSGGAIVSTGPLTITNSLLQGNTALNGGALYPRFAGARTVIINSVLRDNHATDTTDGWGGAILAWDGAPVTIDGSDIYSNTARQGAGIYYFGNSVLRLNSNTRLRDNSATDSGGGLYKYSGTATLTNVTFSGNSATYGGGLYNYTGVVTLTNVTLSGNTTSKQGGGLSNIGTAALTNVTLSGNSAGVEGGGLRNFGEATLTNVTLSGNSANHGGGLYNEGTVTLSNVTLSGNSAPGGGDGGGLHNSFGGRATLTNVTLSGNTANIGGGLYNDNTGTTTTLIHVTFSGNSAGIGGGIYRQAGSVSAQNTIIAIGPSGGNCVGGVTDNGFNLSSVMSCGCVMSCSIITVPNLLLGPLADNGGPTKTHLPLPGSPAIDFVAFGCPPPATDQRGAPRNIGACDAGAVEFGALLPRLYLPIVLK